MTKHPYSRGSEWRKWDLHVHTPESHGYTGTFDVLVKKLEACEADVIGVNDYCTISGYEEIIKRGGIKGKVLFPVVEFRMHNIIANRKGGTTQFGVKINFHVILNNTDEVLSRAKTWLSSLKCYNEKGEPDLFGNIAKDKYALITFDFEHLVHSLRESKLKSDSLIWLPYDEYGGIDDIDPKDNFFKLGLIKKVDIIGSSTQKQIDFFTCKDLKYTAEQYQEWFEKPLPCIKGSDAHDVNYPFGRLKDKDSKPVERYCWIKADPTFQGLRQILNEPEDRVYIGTLPPKLADINFNKAKYLDTIKIQHTVPVLKATWFDSELLLNNSLVAIIGKKGSGKSALADIISLAGKSHIHPDDYSFLTDKKFRRRGIAKNYLANLTWVDGQEVPVPLSEPVKDTEVEKVKYLPQQFVETICNEEDGVSKLFQEEIDKVIFSYVPEHDRSGATNLNELIEMRTGVIDEAVSELQQVLHQTNFEIVTREEKDRPEYKKKVEAKLAEKARELSNLTPPKEVEKPKIVPNSPTQEQVKKLTAEIETVEKEIRETESFLTTANTKYAKLLRVEGGLAQLPEKVKVFLEKLEDDARALAINLGDIVELKIKSAPLQTQKTQLLKTKEELSSKLSTDKKDAKVSLNIKRETLQAQLEKITATLDAGQKLYQSYLLNLKKYNDAKDALVGKKESNTQDTITSLKEELVYLGQKLKAELAELYEKRDKFVKSIFQQLEKKASFFKEIYQPLTKFIDEEKEIQEESGSVLTFDVGPVFNKPTFVDKFLAFINQQRDGSFQGKEGGYKVLKALLDKFDTAKEKGVVAFLADLIQHLKTDKSKEKPVPTDIDNQLNGNSENKVSFYDFIYGLDYLNIKYKILFNGKDLNDNEFSPGEKGTLLLIFYLLIDKNTIPLIMDQPEENLDNESVFTLLVPYIKKAKRKRQIVIVTHNPNLAVVCDAEQIISATMDKKTNEIRYITGSIENPLLNKKVVDVLEGTMPAFNIRDGKYIKK